MVNAADNKPADNQRIGRRSFLKIAGTGTAATLLGSAPSFPSGRSRPQNPAERKPNVVFIFADQWRAEATGYAGW